MPYRVGRGTAGVVFHVMNRAVRRLRLFETPNEYQTFLMCLEQGRREYPLKIYAYCVMPNHFHLVVEPTADFQLADFMRVTVGMHAKRWHSARQTVGEGAVYQGRYRAFPVFADGHFIQVCRYVERNALQARLVPRAEEWTWSSLNQRCRNFNVPRLETWPVLPPGNWTDLVNEAQPGDLARLRKSVRRNLPYGPDGWAERIAADLKLPFPRWRGRPRKKDVGSVFRNS